MGKNCMANECMSLTTNLSPTPAKWRLGKGCYLYFDPSLAGINGRSGLCNVPFRPVITSVGGSPAHCCAPRCVPSKILGHLVRTQKKCDPCPPKISVTQCDSTCPPLTAGTKCGSPCPPTQCNPPCPPMNSGRKCLPCPPSTSSVQCLPCPTPAAQCNTVCPPAGFVSQCNPPCPPTIVGARSPMATSPMNCRVKINNSCPPNSVRSPNDLSCPPSSFGVQCDSTCPPPSCGAQFNSTCPPPSCRVQCNSTCPPPSCGVQCNSTGPSLSCETQCKSTCPPLIFGSYCDTNTSPLRIEDCGGRCCLERSNTTCIHYEHPHNECKYSCDGFPDQGYSDWNNLAPTSWECEESRAAYGNSCDQDQPYDGCDLITESSCQSFQENFSSPHYPVYSAIVSNDNFLSGSEYSYSDMD